MKNFYNIVKKEIRELMTRQMIFSLVFMILMFGMMGKFIGNIREEAEKSVSMAVFDMDRTPFSQTVVEVLGGERNVIKESSLEKALNKAREKDIKALLVIPEGFEKDVEEMRGAKLEVYSILKGLGIGDLSSSGMLKSAINTINQKIATSFVQEAIPGKNPQDIINPIKIKEFVTVREKTVPGNPEMIQGLVTSQSIMIPVILMMVIMYSGMMVITSMGMEKENKTLETLLTLPVKRSYIVTGKMVGSALVALIMAAVYMIGFRYYMSSFMPSAESTPILKNLGLVMTPLSYLLLGTSLFMAILVALSLSMLLGLFAQDTKSAQTMNMPLVILVMIPFFLLMFKDISTLSLPLKILVYAIPFSHPIIASRALIFQNYFPVIGGMIYMAIFAGVAMFITIRIFNTDKVLTAKFSFKKRRKS